MSTVLYHKGGVITEERFQKMSTAQWAFHYLEILKYSEKDKKVQLEALGDIESSIQAFYLIVDPDRGGKMMSTLQSIRNSDKSGEDSEQTKLTDTDRELLDFAETLPETIEISNDLKNIGKFILPTKDLSEIFGGNIIYEEVDSIDDITPSGENDEYDSLG